MHPLFSQGLSYQICDEVPQAMMMAFVKHVKVRGETTIPALCTSPTNTISKVLFCFVLF
jgi:hypothetical protein